MAVSGTDSNILLSILAQLAGHARGVMDRGRRIFHGPIFTRTSAADLTKPTRLVFDQGQAGDYRPTSLSGIFGICFVATGNTAKKAQKNKPLRRSGTTISAL